MSEGATVVYLFDCPIHGRQREVFCWRAFAPQNLDRWHKYERTLTKVGFDDGEAEALAEWLGQARVTGGVYEKGV